MLDNFVLFLTSCEASAQNGSFLIYMPKQDKIKLVLQEVIKALKGKGGGKGSRVQGKAEFITPESINEAALKINELIKEL